MTGSSRPTEAEVLTLEAWHQTSYRRLHACLRGATGSAEAATEALQEAIVKAVESWPQVRHMESPDAWIYTVALNAHRRKQRRWNAFRRLVPQLAGESATSQTPSSDIWPLVAELPDQERVAVALRHLGQLSEPEIASILGTTRGSVSATLRSAHQRLKRKLDTEPSKRAGKA
jgi:RNA polymerase sigma-70 factor (ECF subfamily)